MVFVSSENSENDAIEFSRDVRILQCLFTIVTNELTPLQVAQSEVAAELDLFSEIRKDRKFNYAAEELQ